ncbi:MAG: alkaline phosphatase family protein, partial [Polyangiales bacterium]
HSVELIRAAPEAPAKRSAPAAKAKHSWPKPRAGEAPPPRLLLCIVLDQLGSWVLERFAGELDKDGLLRPMMQHGRYFLRARYPYAGTYTAPGHASIYTGAPPKVHGVAGNVRWLDGEERTVAAVDDRKHALWGLPDHFASPRILQAETVADVLHRQSGGAAHIVSLSMKARAAVLPGGQHADLALWYEPKLPGFTSSRFYAATPPAWLKQWHRKHPATAWLKPWQPEAPKHYAALLGPDAQAGEGDVPGFDNHFPHPPPSGAQAAAALPSRPEGTTALLALARQVRQTVPLGQDAIPDFLQISVSGTDYVGHIFGPASWEYLDHLRRVDRALGAFVRRLRARVPSLAVMVTADHGVTPLPERSQKQGLPGRRVSSVAVAQALEAALTETLGEGPWVRGVSNPFLLLTAQARKRSRAVRDIATQLAQSTPGVHALTSASAPARGLTPALRRAVDLSTPKRRRHDLFLVLAPHAVLMSRAHGTSHGSPWPPDQLVPVLIQAPGVRPKRVRPQVGLLQVAATLSQLLQIEAPNHARTPALPLR